MIFYEELTHRLQGNTPVRLRLRREADNHHCRSRLGLRRRTQLVANEVVDLIQTRVVIRSRRLQLQDRRVVLRPLDVLPLSLIPIDAAHRCVCLFGWQRPYQSPFPPVHGNDAFDVQKTEVIVIHLIGRRPSKLTSFPTRYPSPTSKTPSTHGSEFRCAIRRHRHAISPLTTARR
ncbi:hypothetical protein PHLGIDRAFT_406613 [Phlebiopsis gigantea 11061_1 CR5-6]|uniref:Uncharacterized protein n=1 Tax=Phlebiopsis gigantea (strain 11061_1 CR5-6) TaxID=745531 RepID=A0A0C3SBC7_PHLG1|nr:hypothetical protein PHLGIDRAFT_406613 [Phlebiopsis gigantea 11061_1 CR5-6]